jgi:eukaryotic-like serine/threonine-protein kinase
MESRTFAGKYRTVRELGEGPAGRTWLAEGPGGGEVVVKVIRPASEAAATAVEHDVSLISGIRHPALPTVLEWGHDAGEFFVVREFVPGADLKLELGEQERFAPLSVVKYGSEASDALAQIHSRGLLHGNVKTANLIRTPEDSIKLVGNSLGMGAPVAFAADAPPSDAHYLAPEQLEGGTMSPATDVYAMGVVLYELLAGRVPFDGPTAASVADQQMHKAAVPIGEAAPDIPKGLESVVMRALEKAPEARFANGGELKAALDGALAPPAPLVAVAAAKPKKSPWPWIVLAIVVVAAALIAAWLLGLFGGPEATVPNVVGMGSVEASAAIGTAGLQVGTVTYSGGPVAGIQDGSVSSQSPAQGTRVDVGTKVDLVLAGAQVVAVPNVVGQSEAQALAALQAAGFASGAISNVATTSMSPGTVLTQNPAAGKDADKGSTVDLQIAQTPTATAVPDVIDLTRAEAESKLQNAGFSVSVRRRASTSVPSGRVIEQAPTAGVTAQPGSTVTIIVSSGPAQTVVPDVGGMTQANAVNALTNAGFKTQITFQTGGGTVGTVIDQSPAANTKATTGSTVVITVVQ